MSSFTRTTANKDNSKTRTVNCIHLAESSLKLPGQKCWDRSYQEQTSKTINVPSNNSLRMGYMACRRGKIKIHTQFWWGNLKETDHLKDLGLDGRIVLKCIFRGSLIFWDVAQC
jgi:hypothetical protein